MCGDNERYFSAVPSHIVFSCARVLVPLHCHKVHTSVAFTVSFPLLVVWWN